jgi:hypothetical protein
MKNIKMLNYELVSFSLPKIITNKKGWEFPQPLNTNLKCNSQSILKVSDRQKRVSTGHGVV